MGNGPPILLTLIAGSCLLIIYRLYPPACQKSLKAPRPMTATMTKENSKEGETPSSRERLVRIPRRQSNYSVLTSRMALRMEDIQGWTSCPPATTSHSIWSMAVTEKEALYSSVAAVSIKENWKSSHPLPDMRLLIIEPSVLKEETLGKLQKIGWGLCRVPRLQFVKLSGRYSDSFGKLFIWNMTQYEVALWLDSDTLVVRSIQPLMELAARLPSPGSREKGPRIGASWDGEWWQHLQSNHQPPPPGHVNDDINTGVFIIKPDQEEFLYLLNLLKSNRVKKRQPVGGEQGWLNEVYLWEKFDIGIQYNVRTGVVQRPGLHVFVNNATIFHFAWLFKPDACPKQHPMLPACTQWKHYREKLPWKQP